jgi:FMN phosphatase YigB (HAD superfamily)
MNWNLINALKRLKKEFNLKYYIVTRRKKENVLKHLKRFNLTDLFEDIYSIDKTQKNIKKVLELTGLKVEEVIYVGDFFRWDIINFYRLGFRCIQYYAFTNKFLENDWFYNLIKYFMVLPDGKKSNEKN